MLALFSALANIVSALARYFANKQMLNAGKAMALQEMTNDALKEIKAAQDIRRDAEYLNDDWLHGDAWRDKE